MIGRILDALPARLDHLWRRARGIGVDKAALRRDLAGAAEDDVPLALGRLDAQLEALVVLLQHEHVLSVGRTQPMAPDLEGTHRRVSLGVEERLVVARPGGAVVHLVQHVLQLGARRQIAEANLEKLGARVVGRVREHVLIRAGLDEPEVEVVVATGKLIAVEEHLLGGVHAAGPAAVDLVIQALDRPGVVPVALEERRGRRVGLLDPADDLAVQLLPQFLGRRHDRVGVRVLGLQVGDHLRVALLPHPVIGVDPPVAVLLQHLRPPGGLGGFGRRGYLGHAFMLAGSGRVSLPGPAGHRECTYETNTRRSGRIRSHGGRLLWWYPGHCRHHDRFAPERCR